MDPFAEEVLKSWPLRRWQDSRLVLACSGGPDSTAMVRCFAACHPHSDRLTLAHFNHGLRAEAADADAEFTRSLAQSLELPYILGEIPAGKLRDMAAGEGLESAARQQRYAFLQATAERVGARYVVTGHTADDQAETVLHHVLRGSGLAGLRGMRRHRSLGPAVTLTRPLLSLTRHQVLAYLKRIGQAARTDEHNESRDFLRSRIRHQLLPLLEREFAATPRQSLTRLAHLASEAQEALEATAESLVTAATETWDARRTVLRVAPMLPVHPHLRREAFVVLWKRREWPRQSMTFRHWDALAALIESPRDEQLVLPGAVVAERTRERLVLTSNS